MTARPALIPRSSVGALCVLAVTVVTVAAAAPARAQESIEIEKRTNGQDADAPPGPVLAVGSPVSWTYTVTNTGAHAVGNIVVTDDQGVMVSCPQVALGSGESMVCTANGVAVAGQYVNIGIVAAEDALGAPLGDTDPSHYFGQAAAVITLEKSTEGLDADTPPGPSLPVGDPVDWTYEVTNIGSEDLTDIVVTDDQGVMVSCPGTMLAPGASMTCTASGTVQAGQYANLGSVIGLLPDESEAAAQDPSHYFGQVLVLEKRTNGVDADVPPGPTLDAGSAVVWTYEVSNPGPATVTGVAVTDDQVGAASCPLSTLTAGASMTCSAMGLALAGQYANVGTATATLPLGGTVTATDPSHYFGRVLAIEKLTNGVDADLAPGPSLAVGSPVSWTYEVTNLSLDPLSGVVVSDDQGVVVSCPMNSLNAGESMTCSGAGVAAAGQYANVGTATADHPSLGAVQAEDPSHYFGQDLVLDFGDAPDPAFPTLFASNGARHLLGSSVFLGACVDAEADGQPDASSTGDDAAGTQTFGSCAVPGQDEDGVTFSLPLVPGTSAPVSVVANDDCTLSAWIDFNGDGDWTDAGEDLFPGGSLLVAGSNPLSFAVPATAVLGTTASRFRCNSDSPVSFTGEAADGEVEDYAVTIAVVDFGDAPDPSFPTLAASSGALHVLGSSVFLGACVDAETDGQPNAGASGDDGATGAVVFGACAVAGDDEDGVVFTSPLVGGANATVDVTASAACTLSAWIDFDADGDWGDPGEDLFPGGSALAAGINPRSVAVPATVAAGTVAARFRCTTDGAVAPTAAASDGEVEDYAVALVAASAAVTATKTVALLVDGDGDGEVDPGETLAYTVVLTNGGIVDATAVVFDDSPDPATTLVAGSVTTTQGTVTTGNSPGDGSVSIAVGTIAAGGGTVTITFQVTVADPLSIGVTSVANQGAVTGGNFAAAATDDPSTAATGDPTVIPVVQASVPPVVEIPTLEPWALALLALVLAWAGRRAFG